MAQDVTSLLRIIESESEGQLKTYASLVLSLEKRFIFFFGFIRTENGDSLFNGFRCPNEKGKVFHYHSLSNAVWATNKCFRYNWQYSRKGHSKDRSGVKTGFRSNRGNTSYRRSSIGRPTHGGSK
jgi:hypothetical protein